MYQLEITMETNKVVEKHDKQSKRWEYLACELIPMFVEEEEEEGRKEGGGEARA